MRWLNPVSLAKNWIEPNWRSYLATQQPQLWLLAILIGLLVSCAAIIFRLGIGAVQWTWLGTISESIATAADNQPYWLILLAPTLGGLFVGLFLEYVHPIKRAEGVADVIEARAHGGSGLRFWQGLDSAAVTIVSLGAGASAGREGPMVHLGASLAKIVCELFSLPSTARKTLLACGVASAVSASFNAPIAGVLFAHEVILGHYAMTAFVPIVLASAMGTLLSRLYFGDIAAFDIPAYQITSYWELPAFALLGITCAIVAVLFQFSLMGTDWVARHVKMPLFLRPVIGGFVIGCIALVFPEILGVGYEATDMALHQKLPLAMLFALIIAKTAATAITLASRFGGGIFSPSLYVGAMTGGVFGIIAAQVFPEMASSQGLYSILGMGAVAAAVLGAPVSTTMIVFELTGGYALSIALLITVSIATGLTLALHGRSYFHWQLEMRGVFLQEGDHKFLVTHIKVAQFYHPLTEDALEEDHLLPEGSDTLRLMDNLETALKAFDACGGEPIPVADPDDPTKILGWAKQVDALRYFNDLLIDTHAQEHR